MGYTQLIEPNPNIPCQPGWCLAYVNEAFGVDKKYPSATSAWFGSKTKHEDRDFPAGVWVPVWYGLDTTPLGHVVLLAPDGSVYSTSDLTSTPHHHPDLADLEAYYAYYGMNLTYRGWTEDVEGTPVISRAGIAAMGESITPLEDDMPISEEDLDRIADRVLTRQVKRSGSDGTNTLGWSLGAEAQRTEGIIARTTEAVLRGIFGTKFPRQGAGQSGTTDLGSVVSWSDANFQHAGTATLGTVTGLDPEQVNAAIKAGVDAALAGTKATITLGENK